MIAFKKRRMRLQAAPLNDTFHHGHSRVHKCRAILSCLFEALVKASTDYLDVESCCGP